MVDRERFRLSYIDLKIKGNLGRGGQATVIEADWRSRRVAVKKYDAGHTPDIDLVARLNHRNIIRLLGVCYDQPCIVMEICQGSLHDVIYSEKAISFEELRDWTGQIAEGMEYLHSEKVTHRDLKPMNVLFGLDNGIKLTDFDLSKQSTLGGQSQMTTLCGTPHWMAPEIFCRGPYSHKIDMWSFAVLTWEAIVQQEPYNGEPNYLIRLIMNQLRLPFPVELPGDLRDLLLQCIDFDPNRRPEFADIKMALHSLALIDEGNWKTLKSNWRSMKFNYTISAGLGSSLKGKAIGQIESAFPPPHQGNVSLTSSKSVVVSSSTSPIAHLSFDISSTSSAALSNSMSSATSIAAATDSIELERKKASLSGCPIRKVKSQEFSRRSPWTRPAKRKTSLRSEIPTETNDNRTCRNRVHIYSPYKGSIKCDLCPFGGTLTLHTCDVCHLVCHAKCIVRAPTPCVPRPTTVTNYRTFEEFDEGDKSLLLPPAQPQIFHHILSCILELERRNEAHEWSLDAVEVWPRANELFLKFFNSRDPISLQGESAQTLRCIIQRFHLDLLPKQEQIRFLEAVRRESIDEIKQLISELAPIRRASAALFFSHWKRHLERNSTSKISDWVNWAIFNDWIGVNLPWDMTFTLKRQIRQIEFEFWNRMLVCL